MPLDEVFSSSHRVIATTGSLSLTHLPSDKNAIYSPKELKDLIGTLKERYQSSLEGELVFQ